MSLSSHFEVDPADLEGAGGSMQRALRLWSTRHGPVVYNQFQSGLVSVCWRCAAGGPDRSYNCIRSIWKFLAECRLHTDMVSNGDPPRQGWISIGNIRSWRSVLSTPIWSPTGFGALRQHYQRSLRQQSIVDSDMRLLL